MAGLNQFGVAHPFVRRAPFGWLSHRPGGGVSDRPSIREPGSGPDRKVWTDRVRWSGRVRQKKQVWHEMMGDMPGIELIPDPSLGGAPQVEGPTTHLLGAP